MIILNNLSLRSSYDLGTSTFSPVQVSTGTNLFNQKMTVNVVATLNPYAIDNNGQVLRTFNKNNGGSLFRLTSANLTMNYSLSSSGEKDKKKSEDNLKSGGRPDDLFGQNQDLNNRVSLFKDDEDNKDKEETKFFNSKIPWDLTFAYSLTYANETRNNTFSTNSLMMSGNIDLTPKWKIGASSGFDIVNKAVTYTNFRIERDLLSWRMNFNWVPFGTFTSWGFFIGIKSSTLSDLKWEKNKTPDQNLR